MGSLAQLLIGLLAAYLIGSIPTAFLIVKWLKRVDVRTVGSGNVGATNAARVAGKGAGAVVFLLDAAKGLVAVLVIAYWSWSLEVPAIPRCGYGMVTPQLLCGLAAVAGHCFPVFLQFRGGKGVATTIGVLLGTMPSVAAVCLGVWAACFFAWRYVSIASIAAAVTLPIAQLATRQGPMVAFLGAALALLVVARHRSNIQRLLQGTEHRAGQRADSHQQKSAR